MALTLVIVQLETPWQIASTHRAPRGGGWASIAELQAAKLFHNWHPPLVWTGRSDRYVAIPSGLQIEKWQVDAGRWLPYTRLILENTREAE